MTDHEVTNADRARWADVALKAFALAVRSSPAELSNDPETLLMDLLADLQHWADARRLNFRHLEERAKEHYCIERIEENGAGNYYTRELRIPHYNPMKHLIITESMRRHMREQMFVNRLDQKTLCSLAGISASSLNRWIKGTAKFAFRTHWKLAMDALETASRKRIQPWGNPPEGA